MDDDLHLHIRRHHLVRLNHVAILRDRDIPGYAGAKILTVRKPDSRPSPSLDWRTVLPREWAEGIDTAVLPADPPDSLSDDLRGLAWRWTGDRFVPTAHVQARRRAA
jgi:hypothetical protein